MSLATRFRPRRQKKLLRHVEDVHDTDGSCTLKQCTDGSCTWEKYTDSINTVMSNYVRESTPCEWF